MWGESRQSLSEKRSDENFFYLFVIFNVWKTKAFLYVLYIKSILKSILKD